MEYEDFIRLVALRAHVPEEQAAALTRATSLTLAERITGGEAKHLAGVLPPEIAPPLLPPEDVAQKFGVAEFLRRVSERSGVDETVARRGVFAVFTTLAEAVPVKEWHDIMSRRASGSARRTVPRGWETAASDGRARGARHEPPARGGGHHLSPGGLDTPGDAGALSADPTAATQPGGRRRPLRPAPGTGGPVRDARPGGSRPGHRRPAVVHRASPAGRWTNPAGRLPWRSRPASSAVPVPPAPPPTE